ncbi:MAG: hypothetical protein IKA79_04805 [Lentisphaeria bacterium]|nr:hypothetical protein [Lentisphaeria bacterium]
MPENILVRQSSRTLKATDTSICQRMILILILEGSCSVIMDGLCVFP